MNIVITPDLIRRLEDKIEYIVLSTFARRQSKLWWKRLAMQKNMTTKREAVIYMLDTAKIRPAGKGGNYTYDDITEASWQYEAERYGAGVRLESDEIEDGQGFDRAGQRARQLGNQAALWPQQAIINLLKEGKTRVGYDGVPFWSLAHPVNQYVGASSGVYPNIHYDMPFSPANLAKAYSIVAQIKAPDQQFRKLEASVVAGGEIERLNIVQALGAEFYADPVHSGSTAPSSNVIKTAYSFAEPIIDPDFDETGVTSAAAEANDKSGIAVEGEVRGVWYLGVSMIDDGDLAGLFYGERKAFQLDSYSDTDDAELARMDAYEWLLKGRNGADYGHPFLIHRFEPNAAPP